jgi:hypothetical protein
MISDLVDRAADPAHDARMAGRLKELRGAAARDQAAAGDTVPALCDTLRQIKA